MKLQEVMDNTLFDLYFLIRHRAGWLADCVAAGFSEEEITQLEMLADEFSSDPIADEMEAWDRQIEREGGAEVYCAETQDEKIAILSRRIAEIYRDYEQHMWNDGPYADRAIILAISGVEKMEKLRRGLRGRQLHANKPEGAEPSSRVSDQDIERARAYPIERIIPDFELARAGYVRCRWHDDKKPSMLIKNGFGYCFSCAKSIDSIGWLMEVENMGFIDAVRYLSGK